MYKGGASAQTVTEGQDVTSWTALSPGTAITLITNGRCNPAELIRFMCETAHYFTQTSSDLIKHYTDAIGDGVMK